MDKILALEVSQVTSRIEIPINPSIDVSSRDVPVVITPGKPGPPGKDGAVIGGAVINDTTTSPNSVWSSQHTRDQDLAVIDGLTPEIDLVLLFNNALI